jgi:hypothetical protein
MRPVTFGTGNLVVLWYHVSCDLPTYMPTIHLPFSTGTKKVTLYAPRPPAINGYFFPSL